jgi:hypothetical protein
MPDALPLKTSVKRSRRNPVAKAEAAVRKVADQLAAARQKVAELEDAMSRLLALASANGSQPQKFKLELPRQLGPTIIDQPPAGVVLAEGDEEGGSWC